MHYLLPTDAAQLCNSWKCLTYNCKQTRDVTKFEFEFDEIRTANVFNRFKIRRMFWALCFRMRIYGKILVLRLMSYAQTATARVQTNPFLKFNLSHKLQLLNVQHHFWSVKCYTALLSDWENKCLYSHSHSVNYITQNSHLTNANFDQLRHITKTNRYNIYI